MGFGDPGADACGIHPLEAEPGLLIACGSWLHRDDFTSRFITTGTSISDGKSPRPCLEDSGTLRHGLILQGLIISGALGNSWSATCPKVCAYVIIAGRVLMWPCSTSSEKAVSDVPSFGSSQLSGHG